MKSSILAITTLLINGCIGDAGTRMSCSPKTSGGAHQTHTTSCNADSSPPVVHLMALLGIEAFGGRLTKYEGAPRWNPRARNHALPTQWHTANAVIEWQDKNWEQWLVAKEFERPNFDGDRSKLSSIDALLLNTYTKNITSERLGTIVIQATKIEGRNATILSFSQPVSPFDALKQ